MDKPVYRFQHLHEAAYRAHTWNSMSPDKRADQVVKDYSEQLDDDLKRLAEKGADQERLDQYAGKYESHLKNWLAAKGRCASSMVTGPARFPVEKNRRALDREERVYQEFQDWREKCFKGVEKRERDREVVEAGGPLGMARAKLAELEALQERMKKINAAHKKYLKNPNSLAQNQDLTEADRKIIIEYVPTYSWTPHPFPGFSLTNNNAKIKNTKARVAELEAKEVKAESEDQQAPIEIKGGKVIMNYKEDRIQIQHESKPPADIIALLKSHGFKWSPRNACWQRQITNNAIYVTTKLLIPKLV